MKIILSALFAFCSLAGMGQKRQKMTAAECDSLLLSTLLDKIPKDSQEVFIQKYRKMSVEDKQELEMFAILSYSSKKELIANIDTNYLKINQLKTMYQKLVPKYYTISVEFNPPQKMLRQGESIDLRASKNDGFSTQNIIQEWNIELNAPGLDSLLKIIGWDRSVIAKIKQALQGAHCVSIESGDPGDGMVEIGFARSGMGKYSYKLFRDKLTPREISKYNNGCEYIFYKDNIVLVYGGGAIGPQCFPDKD